MAAEEARYWLSRGLPGDRRTDQMLEMQMADNERRDRLTQRVGNAEERMVRDQWDAVGTAPGRMVDHYREGQRYAYDRKAADDSNDQRSYQLASAKRQDDREMAEEAFMNEVDPDPAGGGKTRRMRAMDETHKWNLGAPERDRKKYDLEMKRLDKELKNADLQGAVYGQQMGETKDAKAIQNGAALFQQAMQQAPQAIDTTGLTPAQVQQAHAIKQQQAVEQVEAQLQAQGMTLAQIARAKQTAQSGIAAGQFQGMLTRQNDLAYGDVREQAGDVRGKLRKLDNALAQFNLYGKDASMRPWDSSQQASARENMAGILASLNRYNEAEAINSKTDLMGRGGQTTFGYAKQVLVNVADEIRGDIQQLKAGAGQYENAAEIRALEGQLAKIDQALGSAGGGTTANPFTGAPTPGASATNNAFLTGAGKTPPVQAGQNSNMVPTAMPGIAPGQQVNLPGYAPSLRGRAKPAQ